MVNVIDWNVVKSVCRSVRLSSVVVLIFHPTSIRHLRAVIKQPIKNKEIPGGFACDICRYPWLSRHNQPTINKDENDKDDDESTIVVCVHVGLVMVDLLASLTRIDTHTPTQARPLSLVLSSSTASV